MRVSAAIMAEQIKANLARQSKQLMETQLKLATGKRINKPSDDPTGTSKVLDYRTTLQAIGQYRRNIQDAGTRLTYTETVLEQVSELVEQAKKLGANPNMDNPTLFARQIGNIRQQIHGLAHSQYGGGYLFAGNRSDTPPFDAAPPYAYHGDDGSHQVVVGKGLTVRIEADGRRMFGDGDESLFQLLHNLETALSAEPVDPASVRDLVDSLYGAADRLKLARSALASDYQRLQKTDDHWSRFANSVESMRQSVEDADITQAAIDMQVQQTAYEVLLATSARVIQPTLVDFLR